jgi:hypothetical protein
MFTTLFVGVTGQICPITQTCCTVAMETNLKNDSEKQFHRNVQDKVIGIRHLLETHARNFDRKFSLQLFVH